MGCWFGCDIKWNPEVIEIKMLDIRYRLAEKISETPYIKEVQRGICKKCGKVHQREIKLDV